MSNPNIKHLEFIQAVITRMNTNSFQVKTWTITTTAALLAVYAGTKNALFVLVAVVPVAISWMLDSYYLTQERRFRGLYNDVAGISPEPQALKPFEMRPDLYVGGKFSYRNVFVSPTIIVLYLPLLAFLLATYFYLASTCS
jgi:hypothetical protein